MAKQTSRPRCECCDEVMEELVTIRQNFEKLFHRLTHQIVELRREVRTSANGGTTHAKLSARRAIKSRSPSPPDSPPTPRRRRSKRIRRDDDASDSNLEMDMEVPLVKLEEDSVERNLIHDKGKFRVKRPMLEFFGIQTHIMPAKPFAKPDEFEDWDALLGTDEDQRDLLRIELLQGHFDSPDKYIKDIWCRVLTDDAAVFFSLRGNSKVNKKSIKSYIFTEIFKECFLQRFERLDAAYFLERTMRYFHYSKNRLRKVSKHDQEGFERIQLGLPTEAAEEIVDESFETEEKFE